MTKKLVVPNPPPAVNDPDGIRALVDLYYDLQKSRIALGNRIKAIERKASSETKNEQEQIALVFDRARALEKMIVSVFMLYVKDKPGSSFLSETKGIGPVLSANLIATYGNCSRFPTISKLWAWSGLASFDLPD